MLRSMLVLALRRHGGPMRVSDLVDALARQGVAPPGRPGKAVSDALRWEVRRGRVRQMGRSTYVIGYVAKSSAWHMRQRVRAFLTTP
jgi:hypothetical protein